MKMRMVGSKPPTVRGGPESWVSLLWIHGALDAVLVVVERVPWKRAEPSLG
jgi:hypothetical protein